MQRYMWIETRLQERAELSGFGHVSQAITRMFGQMSRKPISISELAKRMVISRQAVHQLVREAENYGLIELIPSTEDKRVKLVQFTKAGREMYLDATQTLEAIERELAKSIGADKVEQLRAILSDSW